MLCRVLWVIRGNLRVWLSVGIGGVRFGDRQWLSSVIDEYSSEMRSFYGIKPTRIIFLLFQAEISLTTLAKTRSIKGLFQLFCYLMEFDGVGLVDSHLSVLIITHLMEHTFKKQASQRRFIDYFYPTPTRHPYSLPRYPQVKPHSQPPATAHHKYKTTKLNTQTASSRTAKKGTPSAHQSPNPHSKNTVLHHLHKCRSDWEESTSTVLIQSKQTAKAAHPQGKSTMLSQHSTKTIKNERRSCSKVKMSQFIERTESVLSMYRSKCSKLEQEKEQLRKELQLTRSRVCKLEEKRKRSRKTFRQTK